MKFFDTDNQALLFDKALTVTLARVYSMKYKQYPFREFFPINNSLPSWVQTVQVNWDDKVAVAKWLNDLGKDLPFADVSAGKDTFNVEPLGGAYRVTMSERETTVANGIALPQKKANAVFKAVEKGMNDAVFYGKASVGVPGLFSTANIPNENITANGGVAFATATALEMLNVLMASVDKVAANTDNSERADTVILPDAKLRMAAKKPMGTDYPGVSVLEFFMQYCEKIENQVTVKACNACVGSGTGATDTIIGYSNSADNLEVQIPRELEWLPSQPDGFDIVTLGHAKCGGLHVYTPKSVYIQYGV
jgi:hypothetical protein